MELMLTSKCNFMWQYLKAFSYVFLSCARTLYLGILLVSYIHHVHGAGGSRSFGPCDLSSPPCLAGILTSCSDVLGFPKL